MSASSNRRARYRPARLVSAPISKGKQVFSLAIIFVGVLVLLYPVVASQYNNVKQREFSRQYNQQVQQTSKSELTGQLESARAYNQKLDGVPILDPWLPKVASDPGSSAYRNYREQLGQFEVMARIKIPSANIDLPVYHGTQDEVISKGAGHLYGTALPVGGVDTHAVVTSHSGMSNATLFNNLEKVKENDLLLIDVLGETLAYRVNQIKVVLPNETDDLIKVMGHDYLTVFTCTPYSVNTHRLLVRGERVPYTPEVAAIAAAASSTLLIEPWMIWLAAGATLGLSAIALIAIRGLRRGRALANGGAAGDTEAGGAATGGAVAGVVSDNGGASPERTARRVATDPPPGA